MTTERVSPALVRTALVAGGKICRYKVVALMARERSLRAGWLLRWIEQQRQLYGYMDVMKWVQVVARYRGKVEVSEK